MENLESKIKRNYNPVANSVKNYLVDTSSRLLFYVPIIGIWESLVAGMENEEVLRSRGLAIIFNLAGVGRLHTLCRKGLAKLTETSENSSKIKKQCIDFSAGLTVGFSTYCAILLYSEASLSESAKAIIFGLAYNCLTGNFYGKFNDYFRRKFNLPAILYE